MKKNALFPLVPYCLSRINKLCLAKRSAPEFTISLRQLFIVIFLMSIFGCSKTGENFYAPRNPQSSNQAEAAGTRKTTHGLLPVKLHGYLPTRDNIAINLWSQTRDSYIANIVYDTIFCLNINHRGVGTDPVPYTPDTTKYKDTLRDILSSVQPAAFYSIENEEQHFTDGIYHSQGIIAYCNELKAAAQVFNRKQYFTNGGFTLPVQYWYYSKTGDEDFKTKVIPNINIANMQNKIDSVEYEMNVLRTMPANFINNVHLYLSYSYQVQPLIRMCNYISQYTGHGILCNEAGIYQNDSTLISGLMAIAKGAGMNSMTFYSGDGSALCYPITVEQIVAAEKKN